MSYPVPVTAFADHQTVTITSATFDTVMESGKLYLFASSVDCYIAQGDTPTASAADGSTFVPAGHVTLIDGRIAAKLAVVRDTEDGAATLTPAKFVR